MSVMSRRHLLKSVAAGATLVIGRPGTSAAADAPLISENDPAAKAVKYVEDANKAKGAKPGNTCARCSLYQGK